MPERTALFQDGSANMGESPLAQLRQHLGNM
jgi:hypothetical protein